MMLHVVHMLGEVAAVRMDDIISCSCPTFQGVVMKGIGSLSGSAMMEKEEEEGWAGKKRDDREGGAREMNLSPPAAASTTTKKTKKTGRKNNNNSWFGISSGCVVSRY